MLSWSDNIPRQAPDYVRKRKIDHVWFDREVSSFLTQALEKFIAFITSPRARFNSQTGSCAVEQHGGFCLLNNTITTGMVVRSCLTKTCIDLFTTCSLETDETQPSACIIILRI